MFQNLGITWKREPVLYVALAAAVLNVVYAAMSGTLAWPTAWQDIGGMVIAFVVRGQVTPAKTN